MCEAVLHSHTGLRVSTNFQRWQFPHQVAFPKKRGFLSSRLSRCPTTRAARPVRHNAGGVFLRLRHASSPSCSPSNRPGSCPGSFDKSRTCTHQTTQHDETSRARRQDLQTTPCASTARRRHRLARTAAIRAVFPTRQDQPLRSRTICFSAELYITSVSSVSQKRRVIIAIQKLAHDTYLSAAFSLRYP